MKITLIYSPYLIYTHTFYCKKTSIENYYPFPFFPTSVIAQKHC